LFRNKNKDIGAKKVLPDKSQESVKLRG